MSLIFGVEPPMMILQFALAQRIKSDAINQLALALQLGMRCGVHVMLLLRCMRYEGYSATVLNEVITTFRQKDAA